MLSVLIAVQLWLLALSFSYFFLQTINTQQKNSQATFENINKAQAVLEETKGLPWINIVSDTVQGIKVQDLTAGLKKINISTNNITLETIVFKASL